VTFFDFFLGFFLKVFFHLTDFFELDESSWAETRLRNERNKTFISGSVGTKHDIATLILVLSNDRKFMNETS